MQIDYEFEKCILCMKNPPENWEHVIPESLGGNLQARLLCVSCNSTSGTRLVGNLKLNDSIRLAMEYLKGELPELYSRLMNKATFVGKASDGSLIRVSKNHKNGHKVLHSDGTGGSRIEDTRTASKTLEKILVKNKLSEDQANKIKREFIDLQENIPFDIPGGYTFIKRPIPQLNPELNPKEKIDDRFPTLIAFEFLAILCGNQILNEAFDEIREYINHDIPTNKVVVEQFIGGNKYDTAHAVIFEPTPDAVRIFVRLFRWITYVVTFRNVSFQRNRCIYFEDLKSNESIFDEL
jgi:hypothetical protein